MPQLDELHGWKAIAKHLGVAVRTAQDYAKDRGLPIYHLPGEKGRVFAKPEELDKWRANKSTVPTIDPEVITTGTVTQDYTTTLLGAQSRRWLIGVGIGGLVIITISSLLGARHTNPKEPSSVHLKGRVLELLDQEDRPMWQFTLPEIPYPMPSPTDYEDARPLITDIDGDGKKELLYDFRAEGESSADTLYCFSSEGGVLWTRQIGRELRTSGGQIYPKHYTLAWIIKLPRPTPSGGIIAVGGHRGGTSLFCVELLTKDGQVVGEYYHPGWLWASAIMDLDQDGYSEIILGGVNNAYGNLPGFEYPMTMVVLDSRAVAGEGPAPGRGQPTLSGTGIRPGSGSVAAAEFRSTAD